MAMVAERASPAGTSLPGRPYQTLQVQFLRDAGPFEAFGEAQAEVDVWREEDNNRRPHHSLDMACPADKFRPLSAGRDGLELWVPADLEPSALPLQNPKLASRGGEPVSWPDAIEIDRLVPRRGI
jgi:hypothetical protein